MSGASRQDPGAQHAPGPGDRVRASVLVRVPPHEAFALFTGHIDAWWKRGARFRHSGRADARSGLIHLEPQVGGRLFESFERVEPPGGERVVEVGRVLVWEPPARLAFSWRNEAFTPQQTTTVEVTFEPADQGTQVTVVHHGWDGIPADHPVRHGQDVRAFLRTMGLWWGEQLSAFRALSKG
ncbi:MAG: SRPBCC domain-containing protein [Rubrivivax sp.]|nr:SRPBCC domain-containing protein [Rubrivivax sp.]